MTLGFGPFTVFGREALAGALGGRLSRRMQDWANRDVPVIRSIGAQYLVVARKGG